jgi:hypothetical protein
VWEGDKEDNIKIDLKETGHGSVEWIHPSQNQWWALANTLISLHVL